MQISMLFQKKPPSALPPVLCTGRRPGGRLKTKMNEGAVEKSLDVWEFSASMSLHSAVRETDVGEWSVAR